MPGGIDLSQVNFAAIFAKAKKVVTDPVAAWGEIKSESSTIESIYKEYLIYLAAIPALAAFIGNLLFHFSLFSNLLHSVVGFALRLAGVYVAALIIEWLAPKFEGGGSRTEAFKLAAYSTTPALLAGALLVIPALAPIVGLLSLYVIYVFWLGIEPTVRVPDNKRVPFVLSLVGCFIVIGIALTITGVWAILA